MIKRILGIVGLICLFLAILYGFTGIIGGGGGYLIIGSVFGIPAIILLYIATKRKPEENDSAIETLKTRYAKGEITKAEFEDMRRMLEK